MLYSVGCEYGIRALTQLASKAEHGEFVLLRDVLDGIDVPHHFVGKVFQSLVRADILISAKGRGGGFALARPAEKVSLREVVEAIDGSKRFRRCILGFAECDNKQSCPQHDDFMEVRDKIDKMLDETTVAGLIEALRAKQRKRKRSGRRK